MRHVDHWVGAPVCFLLTLADRLLRLFFPQKNDHGTPSKILFLKPSEMGGIILSYPLMRRVKKEYPTAQMFFLTFKSNKCLFDVLDIIPAQNVLTIREESSFVFIKDVISVFFRLRKIKLDVVFDLEFFSRLTAIISYLSGAPKRIGFYRYTLEGLYRGDLLTHNIQYNPHLHISRLFYSMAQIMEMPVKRTPELQERSNDNGTILPQFVPTEEQKREIWHKLAGWGVPKNSRIFLVNPGEGRIPLREWPLENFTVLARKLLEHDRHYIAVVGAVECFQKAEQFSKELGQERFANLSGKTSIQELLTLLAIADALITNDSGLAHLASLTSIRQFVLFGPESPAVFSPLGDRTHVLYSSLPCSPCLSAYNHRRSACHNNECLKVITPQDVYDTILEKISF